MNKHTPGPWATQWNSGSVDIYRVYPDGSGQGSALAKVRDPMGNSESTEANADLISAAPDLLEALQRLMFNDCPLTGNPTYEELVEHWEYEDSQGRGEAQDQLFALRAVAKALGK